MTPLIPAELLQKSDKILFIAHLALGDFTYLQNGFRAFAAAYPHMQIHLWVDEVRRTSDATAMGKLAHLFAVRLGRTVRPVFQGVPQDLQPGAVRRVTARSQGGALSCRRVAGPRTATAICRPCPRHQPARAGNRHAQAVQPAAPLALPGLPQDRRRAGLVCGTGCRRAPYQQRVCGLVPSIDGTRHSRGRTLSLRAHSRARAAAGAGATGHLGLCPAPGSARAT